MIAILLADGFEEIEALTPLDILRRADLEVRTVGITGKIAVGAHGISVVCDLCPEELPLDALTLAIFPGGMPGSLGLDSSPFTDTVIEAVNKNGGRLAAICAAPLVLGRRGLLEGKRATCYPGFECELRGAAVSEGAVVTDGNITTSRGMGTALDFSLELVRLLLGAEKASEIAEGIMYKKDEATPSLGRLFEMVEEKLEEEFAEEDECDEAKAPLSEYTAEDYPECTYTAPDTSILRDLAAPEPTEEELCEASLLVMQAFATCNVKAKLSEPTVGPRLLCYEFTPTRAIGARKIKELEWELSLLLAGEGIRITLPLSGSSAFRLEIPRKKASVVSVRSLFDREEFKTNPSRTLLALGKEVDGTPLFADLAKMPHLLVGGATGMGKSVCLCSIITSLIYRNSPSELKLILIDPKCVDFSIYNDIPHLLVPVITEAARAVAALKYAVSLMNARYELFSEREVRSLDAYNRAVSEDPTLGKPLPRIVIVIDELSDLILQLRSPTESLIMQITQKARAAGIHIIIGTQRPTPDVISGVIKANIPTRIAFRTATSPDSRILLDVSGAERLLSSGDMLYSFVGATPKRAQGAFISNDETRALIDLMRGTCGAQYSKRAVDEIEALVQSVAMKKEKKAEHEPNTDTSGGYLKDKYFLDSVDVALDFGVVSVSLLQRKLNIGYSKAAKLIDLMEDLGVISPPNGYKPREVLITRDEWRELLKKAGID